jgi:hypothetical protein
LSQEINTVIPGALIEYSPHPEKAEAPVFVSCYGEYGQLPEMMEDLTKWCGQLSIRQCLENIAECKALFYIPHNDGRFSIHARKAALALFERDHDQALVFEWDRFDRIFVWRPKDFFLNMERLA